MRYRLCVNEHMMYTFLSTLSEIGIQTGKPAEPEHCTSKYTIPSKLSWNNPMS